MIAGILSILKDYNIVVIGDEKDVRGLRYRGLKQRTQSKANTVSQSHNKQSKHVNMALLV
jgi:hypothetical protein